MSSDLSGLIQRPTQESQSLQREVRHHNLVTTPEKVSLAVKIHLSSTYRERSRSLGPPRQSWKRGEVKIAESKGESEEPCGVLQRGVKDWEEKELK